MIEVDKFYSALLDCNIGFFSGVPDSLLKSFCAYLSENNKDNHVIAHNEGGALALAIGNHLATAKIPCVYMQNSGLGNIVNPLLSMADPEVYGIPMLLLIGWRAEIDETGNQLKDEPQHKKQGQITLEMLDTMDVPYRVLDQNSKNFQKTIKDLISISEQQSRPVALVIRKGTFTPHEIQVEDNNSAYIFREEAISEVVAHLDKETFIVSTTGMTSRELFELREKNGSSHASDFLVVGAMGHASQIAVGLCTGTAQRDLPIACLDGDGAMLMHMGSLAINSEYEFCHIVLNNGVHDSVGGQPTVAQQRDLMSIAKGAGYANIYKIYKKQDIGPTIKEAQSKTGASFVEILINKGARKDLGRPTKSCKDSKNEFMTFLNESK